MALSGEIIKTGADLYYDPSYTGTNIATDVVSLATAKTAFTSLEALTWESLGVLSGLTVGMGTENAQELNAINCGVGTIADLADYFARFNPTLLECKDFNVWSKILGGDSYTDATTPFGDFFRLALETQAEIPQGRYRIVSCPYPTGLATAGKEWARDYYYLEKAVLDGEILLTFLAKGELPVGASFTLNGKSGGEYFTHTEYGATEASLA